MKLQSSVNLIFVCAFMEIFRTLNKEKCSGCCFIFWMVSMQWLTFSSFYNMLCHMTGTKVIKVTRDRFKANEFKKWTADSLLSATSLRCIYSFYKSMIEIRTKLFHLLWPWSLIRVNLQCYIKHAVIKIWFFNYFLINAMQYLINVKWLFCWILMLQKLWRKNQE